MRCIEESAYEVLDGFASNSTSSDNDLISCVSERAKLRHAMIHRLIANTQYLRN